MNRHISEEISCFAKTKIFDSKVKKFLIIFLTALILLIPCAFISGMISDRLEYKEKAVENVAMSWAGSQYINLAEMYFFENNKQKSFILDVQEVEIDVNTEIKKKGVFKVPVYSAFVVQKGKFKNQFGTLLNKEIFTKISIADVRGFIDEPQFNINNAGFKNSQDVVFLTKIPSVQKEIPFEIKYQIKGLNKINVFLGAKKNKISIKGNWKDIGFSGDFLPDEKNITDKGFSAVWNVPSIAISGEESIIKTSFMVANNNYSLTKKSLKYAFLLFLLIFTSYFIFEITSKENKKIHPVQYCLLGAGMLMFYLLLVSLSELISFGFSYLISSLMVVFLIFSYTYFVIVKKQDFKFSIGISSLIGLLYLFFYILLKIQDVALLSGSIGLFIMIAIVMYSTRDVNWYNENNV